MFNRNPAKFEGRELSIDSVFSVDMLVGVAEDCPRSDADMVLRGYFCAALEEAYREKGRLK